MTVSGGNIDKELGVITNPATGIVCLNIGVDKAYRSLLDHETCWAIAVGARVLADVLSKERPLPMSQGMKHVLSYTELADRAAEAAQSAEEVPGGEVVLRLGKQEAFFAAAAINTYVGKAKRHGVSDPDQMPRIETNARLISKLFGKQRSSGHAR